MEFTIPLIPEGNEGEFRLQNAHDGQVERANLVDYGTSLNVQGNLVEVVHGTLTPGGAPASLILTEFRFTTLDPPRRFRQATITFRFEDADTPVASPPAVVKIAPEGFFAVSRHERTHEVTRGVNLTVGAGGSVGANAALQFEWSLSEIKSYVDEATLSGIKTVLDRGVPPPNAARWAMSEAKNASSNGDHGVPSYLRLGILVQRASASGKFLGLVDVSAKVDYKYQMERRRGQRVDPVLFDPGREQGVSGFGVDPENLGQFDMDGYVLVQSGARAL
ncbi:uncharacterized protein BJX67DRAFT_310810 [Aspergillus lucknowensis]|uniref:Uncharacterized protein n=1 Tax=Aspergillus lucknowensis TaxID=176173 RepID=A0ABR4LCG2_9EURO